MGRMFYWNAESCSWKVPPFIINSFLSGSISIVGVFFLADAQRLGVVASGGVRSLRFRPVTKTKRCGCTRCVYFYIPLLATPHVVCWCFMSTGWKVAFGMPYLSTRWYDGPNFVFVRGQILKPPLKAVSWAGLGSSLASFGCAKASATCQSACKWSGLTRCYLTTLPNASSSWGLSSKPIRATA